MLEVVPTESVPTLTRREVFPRQAADLGVPLPLRLSAPTG